MLYFYNPWTVYKSLVWVSMFYLLKRILIKETEIFLTERRCRNGHAGIKTAYLQGRKS